MAAGPRMPETREAEIHEARADLAYWSEKRNQLQAEIERLQLDLEDAKAHIGMAGRALKRLGATLR